MKIRLINEKFKRRTWFRDIERYNNRAECRTILQTIDIRKKISINSHYSEVTLIDKKVTAGRSTRNDIIFDAKEIPEHYFEIKKGWTGWKIHKRTDRIELFLSGPRVGTPEAIRKKHGWNKLHNGDILQLVDGTKLYIEI